MTYFIVLAALLAILAAFLGLTAYEARTKRRIFAGARYRLDTRVARLEFIARHVDWGAFSADVARTAFLRAAHDVMHGTLVLVRTVERLLTRAVKNLRETRTVAPVARQPLGDRIRAAVTYVQQAVRDARR